jgi:hypothetical protein
MNATHAEINTAFAHLDAATPRARTPRAVIAGRVLSALAVLFLAFDGGAKVLDLIPPEHMNEALFPSRLIGLIGTIELVLLALYLVPRTAVLGAVLWTGYLGGAIATHARIADPLFSHTLFPIYIAALIWGGLWLRDKRVRGMLAR